MPVQWMSTEEIAAATLTAKRSNEVEFRREFLPDVKDLKPGVGFYIPVKASKDPWVNKRVKDWAAENNLEYKITLHKTDNGNGYVIQILSVGEKQQEAKLRTNDTSGGGKHRAA